ncbi:imm11 family protein [Paenibacillus monticola]|uniref:Immunity MXAN-0049 protein domain-containing protein n=1 Tax=Paenibacillus monticola TaxID=2666075 RepID=A0A7X2L450_9BACL|nr:DUF1629 domain-containing protein [Paenibacillus monticola]MRN55975.1 hypothetical protein [Paenibacillus monticola]
MKVYELNVSLETIRLAAVKSEVMSIHPIGSDFNGESKIKGWWPIQVETLHKNTYSDFPYYLTEIPLVSEKVKRILEPYIADEVEFLPLIHEGKNIYMVNVINILDCIDWQSSEVDWFKEKYFMGFIKLRFNFSKIPNNIYLFKIKETSGTRVYITDAFKELIERNHLQGLDLSVVYDSDFTEEKEQEQQQNYEAALQAIENSKGPEFSYEEAELRVDQNKAVASGKWRMQLDDKGNFWLGDLTLELTYSWVRPVYIPPILLGYQWHETERSKF